MLKKIVACAALAVCVCVASVSAQAPGIKRNLLQRADVPAGAAYEVVFGTAELPAGAAIGKHAHPGIEFGVVLEGETVLMIDGQPDKTYKVGESWLIPAGTAHDAKAGATGAKVAVTYTVEKGKPLASPVK